MIILRPGEHSLEGFSANAWDRWLTIAGDPDAEPEQVRITAGHGAPIHGLTRFKDLEIFHLTVAGSGGLWFDDMRYRGTGMTEQLRRMHTISGWSQGVYATECDIGDCKQHLQREILQRNITINRLGRDLFREPRCAINVHAVEHGYLGPHPDWAQWYEPSHSYAENFLFYNCTDQRAFSQFVIRADAFQEGFDNVAFVNCHMSWREPYTVTGGGWYSRTNHLLLWHVTLIGTTMGFMHHQSYPPHWIRNLSMRGCCWNKLFLGNIAPENFYGEDNHYILTSGNVTYRGELDQDLPTFGDPRLIGPLGVDDRPLPESPLTGRLAEILVPGDATGQPRTAPTSVGAFLPAGPSIGDDSPPVPGTFIDDFETDTGWTVENFDLIDGSWERGHPLGSGNRGDPTTDADRSGRCFLTANRPGDSDVDGGPTRLISPLLDTTVAGEPWVSVAMWHSSYSEDGGDNQGPIGGGDQGPGNTTGQIDQLLVEISADGGNSWVPVFAAQPTGGWQTIAFRVLDYVGPATATQVRFSVEDVPDDSITESGIDEFRLVFLGQPTTPVNPADLNGDGVVDVNDFIIVLQSWGPCPTPPIQCPADLNGDGVVDTLDLIEILFHWS
jgi:hypothetical protein